MTPITCALTIAGSDSSGGAGIQADLKTFAAHGVYGVSAVTAVTAQNTQGVVESSPLAADLVAAQIEAVASDVAVQAVKTGMLATAAIVEAVAAAIRALELPLVTPNIPEAERLTGRRIDSLEQARAAAVEIQQLGASAVVVTGGHMPGDVIVDVLFDGAAFTELEAARIGAEPAHGTGCTFASAVAANLALGRPLVDAVVDAQAYVRGAIEHALEIGRGRRVLDHFWRR